MEAGATHRAAALPLAVLVGLAGCGGSTRPAPSERFEYKATAGWSVQGTPNVTSMTIDGQPYASGELYTVDETFASYDEARAEFVPKNVVITTTTETATFQIDLGACESISMPDLLDLPLVMETDEFVTEPQLQPQPPAPSVVFYVACGSCAGPKMVTHFCP